jgi:TetR/AcrR family transcriptional regulator, lmrAB and yxaGH operons repressor
MRPTKVSEEQLMQDLSAVFRRKGYDGASFADLTDATGLVKASLYHRFPDGKAEVADAVLSSVDTRFADYVLKPAFEPGPPLNRVRRIARRLREFYADGAQWCLLDTLSLATTPSVLRHAKHSMDFWIETFAQVAREAGIPASLARRRAERAVAAIEGSLIVSRVTNNRRPFFRALAGLPKLLTATFPRDSLSF